MYYNSEKNGYPLDKLLSCIPEFVKSERFKLPRKLFDVNTPQENYEKLKTKLQNSENWIDIDLVDPKNPSCGIASWGNPLWIEMEHNTYLFSMIHHDQGSVRTVYAIPTAGDLFTRFPGMSLTKSRLLTEMADHISGPSLNLEIAVKFENGRTNIMP